MKPLLELREVSCHFGRGANQVRAVDLVSLRLEAGQVLGLVGESGSGKSTLGRLICGLAPRSAGSILLNGEALPRRFGTRDFRRHAARVQMVFQDAYSAMNPRMTVEACLLEPLLLQGKARGDERRLVARWLERIGLPQRFARRYPHELSGGQRQRVGIARAFITEPRLVICDEPVSALDVSVQAQIVNLLRDLQTDTGVAMIFIAHDLAVVSHLADLTAVMYHGRIVELGDRALFRQPAHPYTRALVAASPGGEVLAGQVESNSLLAPASYGCAYANRCARVIESCRARTPALEHKANGRRVACYRVE